MKDFIRYECHILMHISAKNMCWRKIIISLSIFFSFLRILINSRVHIWRSDSFNVNSLSFNEAITPRQAMHIVIAWFYKNFLVNEILMIEIFMKSKFSAVVYWTKKIFENNALFEKINHDKFFANSRVLISSNHEQQQCIFNCIIYCFLLNDRHEIIWIKLKSSFSHHVRVETWREMVRVRMMVEVRQERNRERWWRWSKFKAKEN